MKKVFVPTVVTALITLLTAASSQAAPIDNPFGYFNVYSLSNITYTNSDFQGTTGAAGHVTTSNFTFFNLEDNSHFLHAGGSADITGGTHTGTIEAGGNIILTNPTVNGNVNSGGNISVPAGGTIDGNVVAAGSLNLASYMDDAYFTNKGYQAPQSGIPYIPTLDLNAVSDYFRGYSTSVGTMGDTGTIADNGSGALSIQALTGINVFSIDAVELFNAHTFSINGSSDAIVYINVKNSGSAALDSTTWQYSGVPTSSVLLNYTEAAFLDLSSRNDVNILAPTADTTFSSGLVTGNLIVGNLGGSGQVNLGHFDTPPLQEGSPQQVPEPTTMLLIATGLIGIAGSRAKKR